MSDRTQLLEKIQQVGFQVDDLTLYLDTHPDCQKGAGIYHELLKKRLKLLIKSGIFRQGIRFLLM